ncbi:DapH/DapD/GlmU-related protein [Vibrio breoganii]
MIAPELLVIARNHSFQSLTKPMNKQGVQPEGTVKVGDDVWIGQRVIILPNIKVGNGVIIGAGSVVTKNIPDFAIVAGNPAKIIRYRNNEAHEKRYS